MTGNALPVDPDAHPDDQRYQALSYADDQDWLGFHHVTAGPSAERRYVITIKGHSRVLAPADVLPYVTGMADAFGVGAELFPNREDTPPT